ncbi:UNVERIFIED_CONTAM: hypothetical protein K2H54_060550 [Gekko kuhli]
MRAAGNGGNRLPQLSLPGAEKGKTKTRKQQLEEGLKETGGGGFMCALFQTKGSEGEREREKKSDTKSNWETALSLSSKWVETGEDTFPEGVSGPLHRRRICWCHLRAPKAPPVSVVVVIGSSSSCCRERLLALGFCARRFLACGPTICEEEGEPPVLTAPEAEAGAGLRNSSKQEAPSSLSPLSRLPSC